MTDIQLVNLGLRLILEFLEYSGYSESVQWQMTLRINRMLAGANHDNNPEGRVLDYNIYKLGLKLLLESDHGANIKKQAEDVFQRRLGNG